MKKFGSKNLPVLTKVILFVFIFLFFSMSSSFLFSQVKIDRYDATKFYPDSTRITYFYLSGLSGDSELVNFVVKEVTSSSEVSRLSFTDNLKLCMFKANEDVTEEMIVDRINIALRKYKSVFKKNDVSTDNSKNLDNDSDK